MVDATAPTSGSAVRLVDPLTDDRWDAFVATHARARVSHLGAWSGILGDAYRFSPLYLAVDDGEGCLHGVLPMVYKSGPLSGRRLTSMPVVGHGGPLAETPAIEAQLVAAACRLTGERDAVLRLRSGADYGALAAGVDAAPSSPLWILPLPSDRDELRRSWKKQSHVARNVRRAEAAGLTARIGRTEADLRAFYAIYLRTMRKHRAVPHTFRFFELLHERLGSKDIFEVVLVESEGTAVAAAAGHRFGDTFDLTFVTSDDRYLALRPSYALHWEVIQQSIVAGVRYLNLGTATTGGSQASFKAQWGAQSVDQFEYVYPPGPAPGRRATGALQVWRRSAVASLWCKAPIPATRAAGELIYRFL